MLRCVGNKVKKKIPKDYNYDAFKKEIQLHQMLNEFNDNKDIKCTYQILRKNVILIRKWDH